MLVGHAHFIWVDITQLQMRELKEKLEMKERSRGHCCLPMNHTHSPTLPVTDEPGGGGSWLGVLENTALQSPFLK